MRDKEERNKERKEVRKGEWNGENGKERRKGREATRILLEGKLQIR